MQNCLSIEYNELYINVNQDWELDKLCNALAIKKGKKLTKLEKTHLSAALIKVQQKELAEQTFNTLEGMRVSLARGLYSYVKSLLGIDSKKRVYWHELPELLEKAGYKRPHTNKALQIWESISSPSRDNYARDLIDAIEDKLVKIKIKGEKCYFPKEIVINSETLGDQAEEQENYSKAIACYQVPLKEDPISNNYFLVKIASCLNKMELYADLVPLSLFALKYVNDDDGQSRLRGFLGSAFYELALKTLDETILEESLVYYSRSKQRSWGFNVLGIWNSFDLLVKFSQQRIEQSEKYLRKAQLTFVDFKELITNQKSNFSEYKKDIIEDARIIKNNLQDKWLIEELDKLIHI